MAQTTRPLTKTVAPAPNHVETATQIAEHLRYIKAILEMLAAGTWSAAAGAQLEDSLGAVARSAGRLGWDGLRDDLSRLRNELAACVRSDRAPEPVTAAAWRYTLTQSLAPGQLLSQDQAEHVRPCAPPTRRKEASR